MRALSACPTPGCPRLTQRGPCAECRSARRRASDARRPDSTQRGYDHAWARTRRAFLDAHPTCECDACLALPPLQRPPATDVDHLDGLGPHGPRGHDHANLRAFAHAHHSQRTARDQPGGWAAAR